MAQRFVPCTRARMSLKECPEREKGEIQESNRDSMIVEYLESPVEGFLVGNFGVGKGTVKPSLKNHRNWPHLVNALSDPNSRWKLHGLSDCHGEGSLNTLLRKDRADSVHAALPPAAASQVISATAVPLRHCITDNTTALDRTWNRSVLISRERTDVAINPEIIDGVRPVPQPDPQPTVDCSPAERHAIAQAHPIAVEMVNKSIGFLAQQSTPATKRLLEKYFNDASGSTNKHVTDGYNDILSGLQSDIKIECEHKGSYMYESRLFCGESGKTLAYALPYVGFRVHLCETAFTLTDYDLAEILVHEFSHVFHGTNFLDSSETYCSGGCPDSLSRWDAYKNADSYSQFAKEVYLHH